ncbi:MAG: hypothetical protein AMXMBFR7_44260 [Planctomycetota bacterium]
MSESESAGAATVEVDLDPAAPELEAALREHVSRARKRGLLPFLYVHWDGCPPCRRIAQHAEVPLMRDAFGGVYLIRAEHEAWEARLVQTPFAYDNVPVYFRLDEKARHAGMLDGTAWDRDVPEEMAPPLKAFFRGKTPGRGPLDEVERARVLQRTQRDAGGPAPTGKSPLLPSDLNTTRPGMRAVPKPAAAKRGCLGFLFFWV